MAILPFEKEYFFNRWNWKIEYVGHPLLEAIDQTQLHPPTPIPTIRPIVALLPGSRKQEIRKKLPLMLAVSEHFTNYQFVVAKAPGLHEEFYSTWQEQYPNVLFVTGKTYDLLRQSQAALVTSGTATLETALLQIPQVVCYKGSSLSYEIGKRLIKINYISLVNLILNQPLVEELIQYKLTTPALIASLEKILTPSIARQTILEGYTRLRELLQQEEPASKKAATSIIALAKK
jgi:lipid-A-disaccharide synthase